MNELINISGRVAGRIRNQDSITIRLTRYKFELDLNLRTGFEGHENVSIIQRADLFDTEYFAIFSEAFRTFLDDKYSARIKDSLVLSRFKDRIAKIKSSKRVEVYDQQRKETYSQFVNLAERDHSCREAEKSALFFADVFNEKADNYNADDPW